MGATSRNKGKVGEREWARYCTERGYPCHRTAQCKGNTGEAGDVEGLPGIHIEVKRCEQTRIYEWMRQATHDAIADGNTIPIVAHRKNDERWVVIMDADQWFRLYSAWERMTTNGEE